MDQPDLPRIAHRHRSQVGALAKDLSVSIRGPKNQTSKADRTPNKTTIWPRMGHGYARIAGFRLRHNPVAGRTEPSTRRPQPSRPAHVTARVYDRSHVQENRIVFHTGVFTG